MLRVVNKNNKKGDNSLKRALLNILVISLGLLIIGCNGSDNASTSLAEDGVATSTDSNNKTELNSPEIVLNGDATVTLSQGELYTELGASAADADVIVSGGINTNKKGTYLITYIAADKENNISSTTRTVIVKRSAKTNNATGTIQLIGESTVVIVKGQVYDDEGATLGSLPIKANKTVDTSKTGIHTLVYTAPDNTITTRTVIVVLPSDSPKPVISLIDGDIELDQGKDYKDSGIYVGEESYKYLSNLENYKNQNIFIEIDSSKVKKDKVGTYIVTYIVTDAVNNKSEMERIVTVKDKTPPTITLTGENTLEQEATYKELDAILKDNKLGFIVKDNNDSIEKINIEIKGSIDITKVGEHELFYTATDSAGNTSKKIKRIVNVEDQTPPTIELIGEETITLDQGQVYKEQGAEAEDTNKDPLNKIEIIITGTVNNRVGTYPLTYTAKDSAGNISEKIKRTVNVIDQAAPTITLNGEPIITLAQGAIYTDLGATATDNNITIHVDINSSAVDMNKVGEYDVIYTATDNEGNTSEIKRAVKVEDRTPPHITLKGLPVITLAQGETYSEPEFTVTDNNDPKENINVTIDGKVDTSKVKVYELGYIATDSAGNSSERIVRIINIVDKTAPVITLKGEEVIHLAQGVTYTELGATAVDNNDLTIEVGIDNRMVDSSKIGIYEVIYTVKDKAGNLHKVIRIVKVTDKTAPVFTSEDEATVNEGLIDAITLQATDTNKVSYSINDDDSNYFNVNATTGVVAFKIAPEYSVKNKFIFVATASDGVNKSTLKITIDVLKKITARDDQYTLTSHEGLLNVLENDDANLVLSNIDTDPLHGTATIEGNKIHYIVEANYIGNDTFVYQVKNTAGNIKTATVRLTISEVIQQKLNDTGITRCANGYTNDLDCSVTDYLGQDAEHGSNTMSFTKVDNGKCVQDDITGLMWEVKQPTGLHGVDDSYSWYQLDNSLNGGSSGNIGQEATCYDYEGSNSSTYCNTDAYIKRVNNIGWCGYSDWRMPNIEELRSIVDYSRVSPSLDNIYFENSKSYDYWSSSPYAGYSDYAWALNFDNGDDNWYGKGGSIQVRLVRSGQ